MRTTIAWVVGIISLGYLLPFSIAYGRNLPNQWQILVVDLFLGWTLIGWVVSLVMAIAPKK